MSSPMIDSLIRRDVIPFVYRLVPAIPIPFKNDGSLNILKIVSEMVKIFDKELMMRTARTAFKKARVKV
jgi:hypothetical protein